MAEKNETENILHVKILSPEAVLYEGTALSLSCFNKEGEFDILPFHSNFISLIYKMIVIHQVNGENKKLDIGYALLKSLGNDITILTNIDISSYSEILTASNTESDQTKKENK